MTTSLYNWGGRIGAWIAGPVVSPHRLRGSPAAGRTGVVAGSRCSAWTATSDGDADPAWRCGWSASSFPLVSATGCWRCGSPATPSISPPAAAASSAGWWATPRTGGVGPVGGNLFAAPVAGVDHLGHRPVVAGGDGLIGAGAGAAGARFRQKTQQSNGTTRARCGSNARKPGASTP